MAFYIHTTEIDKARAIGQRALQTISFRSVKPHLCTMTIISNLYLRMVIINFCDVVLETWLTLVLAFITCLSCSKN